MGELRGLLNIGDKLESQLANVGITTVKQLKEIGSREAWLRLYYRDPSVWNDPLFRKKSKTVEKFDERLWILLDDMRDTLAKVNGWQPAEERSLLFERYGCAAIHIGVLRRAVVILDKDSIIELINPAITEASGETQEVIEGSIAPRDRKIPARP